MYRIIYTESYNKKAKKFLRKHPEILEQYRKTLQLAELDIHHPSLRLHPLKGKLKGIHSISINLSYRITLYVIVTEKELIPVDIGTHDEVY